jgi:hypothetical protein
MHTLGNAEFQIEIPTSDPQWIAGCGSRSAIQGLLEAGCGSRSPISSVRLLEERQADGFRLTVEMQFDRGWVVAALMQACVERRSKIF